MNYRKIFFSTILMASLALYSCKENSSKTKEENKPDPALILKDTAAYTEVHFIDSAKNFGTVKKGELVKLKYAVENIGTYPLFIVSVQPSCGCTVADYTKGAILPQKSGVIDATFDSNHGTAGSVRKSIIVTTNSKNNPNFVLTFEGKIVE